MLPRIARSVSSPLGDAKLRTGRGPWLLAHVALEKVAHGGEMKIISNSPCLIRCRYLSLTLVFERSAFLSTNVSTSVVPMSQLKVEASLRR